MTTECNRESTTFYELPFQKLRRENCHTVRCTRILGAYLALVFDGVLVIQAFGSLVSGNARVIEGPNQDERAVACGDDLNCRWLLIRTVHLEGVRYPAEA